jgi:hypothetical protein
VPGGPYPIARASAVAETRSVEGNHAMIGGGGIEETAHQEILDHGAVAVEQHMRRTLTPLEVVQLRKRPIGGFFRSAARPAT